MTSLTKKIQLSTIGSDLFERIRHVAVESPRASRTFSSADFAYMEEAPVWVENELCCRASVVVDPDDVYYYRGWGREEAEAQAVVDALVREYDGTCCYVPENVSFFLDGPLRSKGELE